MRTFPTLLAVAVFSTLASVASAADTARLPRCPAGVVLFEVTPATSRASATLRATCAAPAAILRSATQAARAWLPAVSSRSNPLRRSADAVPLNYVLQWTGGDITRFDRSPAAAGR